jgi:hypothetical protein
MPALALFATKYWKEIVVGIAIIAFVGYIMTLRNMVDYYKSKVVKLERIIASMVVRQKELEGAASELSRKYEVRGTTIYLANEKKAKENAERIARDEITKRIRLPAIAVQLFNGTTSDNTESKPTTETVESNVGGAGGTAAVSGASDSGATLNDLLAQNEINKKNHKNAVEQVKEWQSFWSDYVKSVEEADAKTPNELPKNRWMFWQK